MYPLSKLALDFIRHPLDTYWYLQPARLLWGGVVFTITFRRIEFTFSDANC